MLPTSAKDRGSSRIGASGQLRQSLKSLRKFKNKDTEPLETKKMTSQNGMVQECSETAESSEAWISENAEHDGTGTIDTGCQRMAIGRETLRKFELQLPKPLQVLLKAKRFRFRGIGGSSTTKEVAVIPTSLGDKGALMEPAVLDDTPHAPFLISLPLLLALGTVLVLNNMKATFTKIDSCVNL